jgi:hypothetical protein
MKKTFKNSVLVSAFSFLLLLPLLSFMFVGIPGSSSSDQSVLGTSTAPKVLPINKLQKTSVEVIDTIELTVNINSDTTEQYIYNVLPQSYLSDEYQSYVVVPGYITELGVSVDLSKTESSSNLLINTSGENEEMSFPAYIIVFRAN